LEGEKEMTTDLYIQIMGCILLTVLVVLVIACAVWFASFVYDDIVEKRKWRNRK
jgi:hypothetical protein